MIPGYSQQEANFLLTASASDTEKLRLSLHSEQRILREVGTSNNFIYFFKTYIVFIKELRYSS